MGLGHLMDAAARERRRRLLGDDMVAAVRRPSRAQLDAHLAATATGEEPRGLGTLMTSRSTDAVHSSPTVAGEITMEAPCKLGNILDEAPDPVEVERLLCSNAPADSESHPHALLTVTGAPRIDGERPTHHRADTTTSVQVVGLQQVMQQSGRRLCPGPSEQDDASHFLPQVEGPLCSNSLSGSHHPHAKLTGAALVDGGCQTHQRAVTAMSDETRAPETLMTGFNTIALGSSLAGTGETMVEQRIHRSHRMGDPAEHENGSYFLLLVEQTHRRIGTATSEKAGELETLIPEQHTALGLSSAAAEGKFSKVDSKDSDNDSMRIPIFVRHCSGELTVTVSMQESTHDLMRSYSKKTKTRLDNQYFVYKRKRLQPHHTWLSCGLERDSTVHVCTRLLGGAGGQNIQGYINDNKHGFVRPVPLPNGQSSLQMTQMGCQFLQSWIRCFTKAFINKKSWKGNFELADFKFVEGHVHYNKPPTTYTEEELSSVQQDINRLVDLVEVIFRFSDFENVVSEYPPYVEACIKLLRELVGPIGGDLFAVKGALPKQYKVLLDSLVCCMTSSAREKLIIEMVRKYEGADKNETVAWERAIRDASCLDTWHTRLLKSAVFGDFIKQAKNLSKPYSKDKIGAFYLLRDVVMHAGDFRANSIAPQLGPGIELMIPANEHFKEFLPDIIKNLVKENIDLSLELSAVIWCSCSICDPDRPSH